MFKKLFDATKLSPTKQYQLAFGLVLLLEALVSASPIDLLAGPVDEILSLVINAYFLSNGFMSKFKNGNNDTGKN